MNRLILSFITTSALIFAVFLHRGGGRANGQGPCGHMDAGFCHA
jgi:hypothetical protein